MNLDNLMITVIVGAIAGILIDVIWGGMKIGIVGAIVIGILGAIIGAWIFSKFDLQFLTGWVDAILKPFIGAVIFLVVIGFLRRD
jgi:uncharacterized membrane protein YeaQ/YmgE (transglycosylase-associated protein family)